MKVYLKCFATLTKPEACDFREARLYDLQEGQTVADLAECAGIDRRDVKIAFINHRITDFSAVLSEGDQVGLAPAVGGM